MRNRGNIFKDFKEVKIKDDPKEALKKMNYNNLLLLEVLADIRANTDRGKKRKK
jgi:hypothetical protein